MPEGDTRVKFSTCKVEEEREGREREREGEREPSQLILRS